MHNIPVAESMFTPLDLFVCLQNIHTNTSIVISKRKSCNTTKQFLFTQVTHSVRFTQLIYAKISNKMLTNANSVVLSKKHHSYKCKMQLMLTVATSA